MANKIKDTDYLVISARIKAMESGLLTRERMEQILDARSDEEVQKILQDCGYPELDAADPEAMDAAPAAARDALLHTMACKASIKGGRASDPGELRVLMDKVQSGEVQYCPHGRPVKVRLSKYEIEKMFKRA